MPTRRPIAALNLSRHVPDLSRQGRVIVQAMIPIPAFSGALPLLATTSDDLDALDAAEVVVLSRLKGAVETRDVKRRMVVSDLQQLRAIVQGIADASPADAEAIILSAGMSVKRVFLRQKNTLSATQGAVSGMVELTAAFAGDRACYHWEMSADDGTTWSGLPPTMRTRTSVSGLAPAIVHSFRYQAVTLTG